MFPANRVGALLRGCRAAVRGQNSSVLVYCGVPFRGAHGGGQGDNTRHKQGRNQAVKYFDIPRIPGVTYMPRPGQSDTEALLPTGPLLAESTHSSKDSAARSADAAPVNPEFFNRNPRNLEMMNLAVRRRGWALEADTKDFYNKIQFERTPYHTRGSVLHTSGRVIVSASTEEFGISKFLYRTTDISAARNIGRILGRRMLETGIVAAHCGFDETERKGNRLAVFLQELTDSGIQLEEGKRIEKPNPFGGKDAQRLK